MIYNTYIINLDSQPGRWMAQSKALAAVGMTDPVRVPGTLASELSDEFLADNFTAKCAYTCPKSIIGCASSHKKAAKLFLDTSDDTPFALVMEDDAYPLFKDIRELNTFIYENVPKDLSSWDIYMLHCDGYCSNELKTGNNGSMAAYLLTKRGARKLIDYKFSTHLDIEMTYTPLVFTKIVAPKNMFWTDENSVMSSDDSTNRIKSISFDNPLNTIITPVVFNRGEKTVFHSLQYKAFRIPIINVELSYLHVKLITIFFITFLVVYLYKKIKRV